MMPLGLLLYTILAYTISTIWYIQSIRTHKIQPNLISWFFWSFNPLLGFGAALSGGVGIIDNITVFASGFSPLIIFITICACKPKLTFSHLDILCGVLAATTCATWLYTHNPLYAIWLAILTDVLAGVPTIVQTYKNPAGENSIFFINGIISNILLLLTIKNHTWLAISFPIDIIIFNTIVILPIFYHTFSTILDLPQKNPIQF
jgi:hypothetical protein